MDSVELKYFSHCFQKFHLITIFFHTLFTKVGENQRHNMSEKSKTGLFVLKGFRKIDPKC